MQWRAWHGGEPRRGLRRVEAGRHDERVVRRVPRALQLPVRREAEAPAAWMTANQSRRQTPTAMALPEYNDMPPPPLTAALALLSPAPRGGRARPCSPSARRAAASRRPCTRTRRAAWAARRRAPSRRQPSPRGVTRAGTTRGRPRSATQRRRPSRSRSSRARATRACAARRRGACRRRAS